MWLRGVLKINLCHQQFQSALPDIGDFIKNFMNPKLKGTLLIIYGSNGCGKTCLAKRIQSIFTNNRFKIGPVYCDNAGDDGEPGTKIADSIFAHWPIIVDGTKNNEWGIFDYLQAEYLTILDDCGAEHDPSGIGLEKLYLILNRREQMRTIITTNFPPDKWEEKFERRISSRMLRNSVHINLSEVPDYSTI